MENSMTKLNLNEGLVKIIFNPSLNKWHAQNFINIRAPIDPYLKHRLD